MNLKKVFVLIIISFVFTHNAYAQKFTRSVRQTYIPQAGDIILFQTPRPEKRIITRLATGASITHSAIVFEENGEKFLLYAIGHKNNKAGDEDDESGVIIESLKDALLNEPDRLFVRTFKKGKGLTSKESKKLTEFAHSQLGKPFFEDPGVIVITSPTRFTPPPQEYKNYFCSKLVSTACIVAGIVGKDSRGTYINPSGVTPADLATDQRINLSRRYNTPVPLHINK